MYVDAGDVYAVSTATGDVQWIYEDVKIINPFTGENDPLFDNKLISKITYGGGTLYFVQKDGTVVGIDPQTGEVMGTIEITPKPVYYLDDYKDFYDTKNVHYNYFLVAASDKYVAAYYSDSHELIVFERTDVEL